MTEIKLPLAWILDLCHTSYINPDGITAFYCFDNNDSNLKIIKRAFSSLGLHELIDLAPHLEGESLETCESFILALPIWLAKQLNLISA